MEKIQNNKIYDLEERSFGFARDVRLLIKKLPVNVVSLDDCKQVIRSSGSVGANYIEANEALGQKDFLMRIKICRKEAKETIYWLRLLKTTNSPFTEDLESLTREANELMAIFGSILRKTEKPKEKVS